MHIQNYTEELIKLRRYFHQHPELALQEVETSAYIQKYLKNLGYEVNHVEPTGIIAELPGLSDREKMVVLRAEMDALPIQEQTDMAYASVNDGCMHACGHDFIIAAALILAKIVTEEQEQKGYVWMNEVNNNIFDATYEDIVAYFGVEGQFVKEEYSDHMKANYRYYKWISEDDDSHFIYVNFKENESGVYTVSAYNTSGFSGTEAIEKYLDIVKAEAAEANKAASANAEMKDFSVEIAQFAKDDVKVKIMTKIPVSGWSFDDGKRSLVENDDPTAFGAGAIQFEVRAKVEDFDYYKDSFENYQDIEDRVIGGITFRGRTYKYIGYEWIQYIAQLDDSRALSIGLRNLDCVPGTMPDIILSNMSFR